MTTTLPETPRRAFAVPAFAGVLVGIAAVTVACFVLVPRHGDLSPLADAVVAVGGSIALAGLALCVPARTRALGAGVAAGAVLGLLLAWSALIVFVFLVIGP
ncbi:hypothetical protein ABKW28_21535 [Nocardioides sp. 31GB23]|uniref:hypothetical protein n=1 Tax=Nocardioides sp. 31GB23 TaxID=3156065 RepID=UPI0032AF1EB9